MSLMGFALVVVTPKILYYQTLFVKARNVYFYLSDDCDLLLKCYASYVHAIKEITGFLKGGVQCLLVP